MKIRAKFKGKDRYRGYRTGRKYWLWLDMVTDLGSLKARLSIDLCNNRDFESKEIRYVSLKKFLENWEVM